jgi:hypothetical protein
VKNLSFTLNTYVAFPTSSVGHMRPTVNPASPLKLQKLVLLEVCIVVSFTDEVEKIKDIFRIL